MASDMLKAALYYRKQGYSVVPVRGKDGHLVKWGQYQNELPSEDQINEWWGKLYPDANIAIVTGRISNLTVIDVDLYKLNAAQKQAIEEKFPTVATPIVHSASGGEHRYFEYDPSFPNKADIMKGLDVRNDGGVIIAPPSKNNGNMYKWDERAKISIMAPRTIPDLYKENMRNLNINSYSLYSNTVSSGNSQELTNLTNTNIYYTEGRRDEDLFHAANSLIKGKADPNFVRQTIELIARNLGKEFLNQRYLDEKINSVLKRIGRQDINITDEVKEWIELTEGNFDLTQCSHELTLTNKNQKQALYMAVKRLCDQGVIEKFGEKRGVYRKIEKRQYEDWMNADYNPIEIQLPFYMGDYVDIFPGDMVVIAGVKNAGKTALALNFIELNLDKWDCYYHSSELVKQTFKLRVSKSEGRTLHEWSKVKMTSGLMMTNAKDRVVKDALNVFDYIEGDEGEFFKIPAAMARIHRALGNGIAVVCLQKPKERDFARGGEGTKDKAALYLTIDKEYPYHVCRITECKAFKNGGDNPTGFMQLYKVSNGINLHTEGGLKPEEEHKYEGKGFKK